MSAVLNPPNERTVSSEALSTQAPNSVASATERLALSRRRLQIALAETVDASRPKAPSPEHSPNVLMDQLKAIPGVGLALQALSAWWAKYPLNAAGTMALEAANTIAKPLASRHPVPLVLAALLLGGVLAWSRPWRWILKPALFAGLMAQLSAKLVAQVPLQSWMALLTAFAQGRAQPPATPSSGPAEPSNPRS